MPQGLMVLDHIRQSHVVKVEKFVQDKLAPFKDALQKISLYVTLKHTNMKAGSVCVKWKIPKRPRGSHWLTWRPWMEVRILCRKDVKYPFVHRMTTGTVQVKNPADQALMGVEWFYEYSDVKFQNEAEMLAFGLGFGLFKILRKLKLVPGLATRIGMIKNGLAWKEEFAEWRKTGSIPPSPIPPEQNDVEQQG